MTHVPGDQFNLDHVVLSAHGVFVVETKTWRKPRGNSARVSFTETSVLVNGRPLNQDPVQQARAGARWLSQLLEESTGRKFAVRGVVVFPGWFVEPMTELWKRSTLQPWVLEPKALPASIANERVRYLPSDVSLAAYHLGRYVRTRQTGGAPKL